MTRSIESDRNIFQIYISDDNSLPPDIKACVESVTQNRGEYNYHLFTGNELRTFIASQFPAEVLAAYEKLTPYSYKSDLGRYCLLYKYGGWYLDITVRLCARMPRVANTDHIVFRDAPAQNNIWDAAGGIIYSKPGSPILKRAIEMVVENCRTEFYGLCPLDPTGPGVWGRAIAMHGPDEKTVVGMYLPLTPTHALKNYAFLLPDGKILAWGKKTHGTPEGEGLAHHGGKGTNSYNQIYKDRNIYRSDS